jgi:hypothetical protein
VALAAWIDVLGGFFNLTFAGNQKMAKSLMSFFLNLLIPKQGLFATVRTVTVQQFPKVQFIIGVSFFIGCLEEFFCPGSFPVCKKR